MTQTDSILDAPTQQEPKDSRTYKWLRGIAVGIEIFLWLIVGGMALVFKMESWQGSSELLILFFTLICMFYLVLTFLVTGARGLYQILGALGIGFSLAILLSGVLFTTESWAGGREMLVLGITFSGIGALATVIFLIRAMQRGETARFYWNALVRLGLVLALVL